MDNQTAKVILAGAGPGDPDLITVRLAEALRMADVILVDRLVNPEIVKRHANRQATIVPVGKQGHSQNSFPQHEINRLLVEYALTGKMVLRLKGGDVSVYSNAFDEIQTLQSRSIYYEIIPGITAASGAAASLGIPLTARTLAPGLRIQSLAAGQQPGPDDFNAWANAEETLAFYMSVETLPILIRGLLEAGAEPDLPFALIERATLEDQIKHVHTLGQFLDKTKGLTFASPALVLIGKILNHIQPDFIRSHPADTKTEDESIPPTLNNFLHVI